MTSDSATHNPLRESANAIDAETFRALGHDLVNTVADFLATLPERPVTPHTPLAEIRGLLNALPTPQTGRDPATLLQETAELLFDHSLFNGHPRFMGYIFAAPCRGSWQYRSRG